MLMRARASLNALKPISNTRLCAVVSRRCVHYDSTRNLSTHRVSKNADSLHGRAVAVKDNIVTRDGSTSAAAKILTGHISPFDATVVRLLKEHGANICRKTDLDEFGMGSHNQHSAQGSTVSPYKRGGQPLSPGGSSGGSAVAVATNQCWAALGTDTGGSVRLPAAYTGVVGFKPSYGMLSRWGVIQYANSLDTVGILSRDVNVCRQLFHALNTFDQQDPSSLPRATRQRILQGDRSGRTLRIGVPIEYNITEMSTPVRSAWAETSRVLRNSGHEIVSVSLPTTQTALSTYYILAPAEASSNLAKYDGVRYGKRFRQESGQSDVKWPLYASTRGRGFGSEVQRRILLGAYTLSSTAIDNYFIQAQKVRRLVQDDFNRVFTLQNPLLGRAQPDQDDQGVDFLLTPTAPTLPPTIEQVKQQSSTEAYMNDVFTVPASLAGLPAISIPVPITGQEADDVQSIGMQVIGQFGDDEAVLSVAEQIMQSVN